MSKHLFGLVITPHGTAANNRGENEGNITTLQKLLWNGEVHTTVSAEAIRWAIRYYWQRKGISVNREWKEDANDHKWQDPKWERWSDYIDDDVLGFMVAEAGKTEGNDAEAATHDAPLDVSILRLPVALLQLLIAISQRIAQNDIGQGGEFQRGLRQG